MTEEIAMAFAIIFEGLNMTTIQAILDDIKDIEVEDVERADVEKFKIALQDQLDRG